MSSPTPSLDRELVAFGGYALCLTQRRLFQGEREAPLGRRAMAILATLVEQPGAYIANDVLIHQAWPDVRVDEANLRVQVAALRKALGEDGGLIQNAPGRGYCFTGSVKAIPRPASVLPVVSAQAPASEHLLGRDQEIAELERLMASRRLVTVLGAGGMGKTTLASAVAARLADRHADGVRFIDLSPLRQERLVAAAVATALDLKIADNDDADAVARALVDRDLLLVLDNCEHLIAAVAELARLVLVHTPNVAILATSREALDLEGEQLFAIPPLGYAASESGEPPAVTLFRRRAAAAAPHIVLTPEDGDDIAELCRQLDGQPLAIELAAGRIEAFGMRGLLASLGDRLSLLRGGLRSASPRQQTLRATLDWSHEGLSPKGHTVLRRLSVFRASFSFEALAAIAADSAGDDFAMVDAAGELVAKSLLVRRLTDAGPMFRLLETTRLYAEEKLKAAGEAGQVHRRHADYSRGQLAAAEDDWVHMTPEAWRRRYDVMLDDVRAALDWAFGPQGDAGLGLRLTLFAGPLWFASGRLAEHRARLEVALARAADLRSPDPDAEMRLNLVLSSAAFNTVGAGRDMAASAGRCLALATELGDVEHQLRALWGLSGERYISGDYRAALAFAERFGQVAEASGDEGAGLVHDRMMALALHLVGEQTVARRHAERALHHPQAAVRSAHKSFYEYDSRVAARTHLARIAWVQGRTGEASNLVRESIEQAAEIGYAPTLLYTLAFAGCPVAFWSGNQSSMAVTTQLIEDHSDDPSYGYWRTWAQSYRAALTPGAGPLTALLDAREPLRADLLATIDGRFLSQQAIDRAWGDLAPWCQAEVLRLDAEDGMSAGRLDTSAAIVAFGRAFDLAAERGAWSWALRSAISLANLDPQGAQTRRHLESTLAKVEAHSTHDRRTAEAMLGGL